MIPLPREIERFFSWFSHYEYYGIPVDLIAHFFVGAGLFGIALKLFKSSKSGYIFVFVLALVKEVLVDLPSTLHSRNFFNPMVDVMMTLLGVACAEYLIGCYRSVRR